MTELPRFENRGECTPSGVLRDRPWSMATSSETEDPTWRLRRTCEMYSKQIEGNWKTVSNAIVQSKTEGLDEGGFLAEMGGRLG